MVERQKEQIKYETEILRFAWVTAVAVTGGNASLLLGEATVLRTGLLLIGLLYLHWCWSPSVSEIVSNGV